MINVFAYLATEDELPILSGHFLLIGEVNTFITSYLPLKGRSLIFQRV